MGSLVVTLLELVFFFLRKLAGALLCIIGEGKPHINMKSYTCPKADQERKTTALETR
jgi:hypothetical protein